MLSERYGIEELGKSLVSREDFGPYPRLADRASWDGLTPAVRDSLLENGAEAAALEWPVLPASVFLDFARNGNRSRYQGLVSPRRGALPRLVLAESVENTGRFLDPIVDGIWCTCEETYWGLPAHVGVQAAGVGLPDVAEPTVDLFAAEAGAMLAWTAYLLSDRLDTVSELVRPRIEYEIRRRILEPCMARDYGWMGLYEGARVNNWNPWICSNWLACLLLVEGDPARRAEGVARILRCLDVFIEGYPEDGGCDEGPGYWSRAGASLFDCLELLQAASGGAIDVYGEPLIRNMGSFIYRAHIADGWLVNFADASARGRPPASLVYRYGRKVGDEAMCEYAAFCAERSGESAGKQGDCLGRALPALFELDGFEDTPARAPLPRDVWLPDTQFMVARPAAGSTDGLFLAAKGGHNAESHNHNDVGTFIVFRDGKPVLIDAGVETYRRQTFSPERYAIWTMQSQWHNQPTVNGVMQSNGREYAAGDLHYEMDDARAVLDMDISGAWPEEAGIRQWRRRFEFERGDGITVTDTCELSRADSVVFNLLTPCDVQLGEGSITLGERVMSPKTVSGSAHLAYDAAQCDAAVETVDVEDAQLRGSWGERLFRVTLTVREPQHAATYALRIS